MTENGRPVTLAILADDLTGALDAAAPFAGRGMKVEVALHPGAVAAAVAAGPQVIAVSTRSRGMDRASARAAVATAASALPGGVRILKKIDSRLKGNIAAELSALSFARALVVPAIVDFGRRVEGGAVTGFGVPVPLPVAPALGEFAERSLIPDVTSEGDMRAALALGSDADLLVGARGLAEALARQETGREAAEVAPLAGPRGVLAVGSCDPITLAQVAALRGSVPLAYLPAPNGVVGAIGEEPADLVLVQALPGASAVAPEEAAANLARGLHPRLTSLRDTLFLTGGATAEAVLAAMGIERVRLLGECLPGLPVATAGCLTIVAKSGGFGDGDTLVRVARMIGEAGP